MLKTYLTRLHDIAIRGDAREESLYLKRWMVRRIVSHASILIVIHGR